MALSLIGDGTYSLIATGCGNMQKCNKNIKSGNNFASRFSPSRVQFFSPDFSMVKKNGSKDPTVQSVLSSFHPKS